uniref:Calponin-homology (CH) domain-containing protein n=1 Tax=Neogobius melanostomus TaxID=47308 RepID=A0A8C6UA05_9GOBI
MTQRLYVWLERRLYFPSPCVQAFKDENQIIQFVQKTMWLQKFCDLFQDIQDGRILMMLLEELTGCKLLYRYRSSSHRIFRLNNISKALAFLDDRHVSSLLGIDASAVADGVPSVVLNLMWNIILYFQVKEMTGGLHRRLSSSLSSLSMGTELTDESAPMPGQNTAKRTKYNGKTIKSLLHWVKRCTVKFGVEVHDFGRSWRNGLAFLALIKSIQPDVVDLRQSLTKDPKENLEQAFRTAHQHLDIPPLLAPQAVSSPHISKFRSLETLADREEAQPVFSSLETSHELLLWKRWARRSSNSAPKNKRKSSSAREPPSPLHANVANPDIRSWLIEASDHGYSKTKNNEINFSLTSEEGIYSLTPLDSDEEDAYSYILDLNEGASQSQAKRKVLRVEEETEEISLINDNGQAEMFRFSGNAESELHTHNEDLNGDCTEKSADTEQDRIERMTQVDAGHPKKPEDNLHYNDKAESQLQAPNDLIGPKALPFLYSNTAVLVQSVAPSTGLNCAELYVMLFLWMLLYCYFIGQQIIYY